MKKVIISKATIDDVEQILSLQESLLVKKTSNTSDGFLVSGFKRNDYINFIEKYNHFYVAKINNEVCGALMAYNSHLIDSNNNTNMLLKYSLKTDFILIKQIFVSKEHSSNGIASTLYNHLFSVENNKLPFVAVIVSNPINVASYKFHFKHKFQNYLDFEPDKDIDNVLRTRSAWIRIPEKSNNLSNYIRFTNNKQFDNYSEAFMSRSHELISLYTHEDNLNWTKMGMQITLIFALFASFIYFYEKELIPESIPVVAVLSIWGFAINLVFYLKIKSGLKYMKHHKESVKTFDNNIKLYFPIVNPIFPPENKISRNSITTKLLPILSLFGLISWLVVSLLLILKGLNIYSLAY